MTAEEIIKLLRQRFAEETVNGMNRCVLLEQVPNGTGMYQSRWIDAVVFQMWASKGLTRSAFEIKVSRSDFLNELQHSEKHQWCKECFHEFWFVAPKDVIQAEELPDGIGWMYPRGDKLCISRHAKRNDNPQLDDHLLAAFMRAASKQIKQAGILSEASILEKSEAYKRASMYMEATSRFLNNRGNVYLVPNSTEDIIKALEEATIDKQLKQDREKLLSHLEAFQNQIVGLLNLFAIIASKGLLARNELGEYIVSTYGGRDTEGLEELKRRAYSNRDNDFQKRYAELVEVILSWEKIAQLGMVKEE